MGNERLLLRNERGFRVFWIFFFLLLGGFRTPWVGGPRRGFRKYLNERVASWKLGSWHGNIQWALPAPDAFHRPKACQVLELPISPARSSGAEKGALASGVFH